MNDIRLHDIHKRYRRQTILNGLNLELKGGQCCLLRGANGAGKSTLLRIMAGLEKPDRGRITLNQGFTESWKKARKGLMKAVVYLHQQPYLFDGDVQHNLAYPHQDEGQERQARIQEALAWADLNHLAKRSVHALSGGERQRVALARAWLSRPQIMLLDEPTANLDEESRSRCIQMMRNLRDQGISLIIASHDPQHFGSLVQQTLVLEDARLHALDEDGTLTEQTDTNVARKLKLVQ